MLQKKCLREYIPMLLTAGYQDMFSCTLTVFLFCWSKLTEGGEDESFNSSKWFCVHLLRKHWTKTLLIQQFGNDQWERFNGGTNQWSWDNSSSDCFMCFCALYVFVLF